MTFFKRVAIVGSTGQLGRDLVQVLSESGRYEVHPITHEKMDVADRGTVTQVLANGNFDVVVNCAAFNRVDDCEELIDKALQVNTQGAFEVARACSAAAALCVYISTDYVFSGEKGASYIEEDLPAPINAYGLSKLAGELLVRQKASRWLILRIASVFGKFGSRSKGGNFIEAILAQARSGGPVRVVSDIRMSPAYTMDVAHAIDKLIQLGAEGLFHCSNTGRCTWFEFASEVLRLAGLNQKIEPVTSDQVAREARRPKDSSMISSCLQSTLGHPLRSWQESLKDYMIEKGHMRRGDFVSSIGTPA